MKKVIAGLFFLFSAQTFADTAEVTKTDLSDNFRDYLSRYFTGKSAGGNRTWDYTSKENVRIDIFGKEISDKVGHKVIANGGATIGPRTDAWGEMNKVNVHVMNQDIKMLISDYHIEFEYSGWANAQKYTYPGHVPADKFWSGLNPHGLVKMHIVSGEGTDVRIEVSYHVYRQGDDNRPNQFVADIALGMKHEAQRIIKDFMKSKGLNADVIFK